MQERGITLLAISQSICMLAMFQLQYAHGAGHAIAALVLCQQDAKEAE